MKFFVLLLVLTKSLSQSTYETLTRIHACVSKTCQGPKDEQNLAKCCSLFEETMQSKSGSIFYIVNMLTVDNINEIRACIPYFNCTDVMRPTPSSNPPNKVAARASQGPPA